MKKTLKLVAAGLIATTALVASASAASFDHCAHMLKNMGLFQGGTAGYELDRAPTRAEAATMLVRLLGKESAAKELTYSAPFSDLDDWQKPYVQYLYDNQLTSGSTATTFDPEAKCDAKMYTTFLLRALGYSDAQGADFTYDQAINKAKEINLVDGVNCNETNFLRDNVAAMSYTALTVAPKDKSADSLLAKLVKEGAITESAAAPMTTLMTNFKEYTVANATYAEETNIAMKTSVAADVKANGANMMKMDMAMDMAMETNNSDLSKSKISATGTTKIELDPTTGVTGADASTTGNINYYYTDGVYYMSDGTSKIKMPLDFDTAMSQLGDLSQYSQEPFSMIKSLEKKAGENGAASFTVKYAGGAMGNMVDDVLASMNMDQIAGMGDLKMSVGDMDVVVNVVGGKISAMDMIMKMSMAMQGESIEINMTMKCSDIKTGSDIKATLPTAEELATYQTMDEALA